MSETILYGLHYFYIFWFFMIMFFNLYWIFMSDSVKDYLQFIKETKVIWIYNFCGIISLIMFFITL